MSARVVQFMAHLKPAARRKAQKRADERAAGIQERQDEEASAIAFWFDLTLEERHRVTTFVLGLRVGQQDRKAGVKLFMD